MKPTDMHRLCHGGCHINGPKDWHEVPVVSGDYDLDATIMHRNNKDMPKRLNLYVRRPSGYGGEGYGDSSVGSKKHPDAQRDGAEIGIYGTRSGYAGYKGYQGDD